MKTRRLLAMILALFLLPLGAKAVSLSVPEDRKVTVIVEVEGNAVLETREAIQKGASEYTGTKAAKRQEESILRTQATVQEDIEKKVSADAEVGYTYTYLLNGFSMEIDESDIEKIKALSGVKAVWITEDILLDDPIPGTEEDIMAAVDNCCSMMEVDTAHSAGYRGEGMAIAVIDSEFDVGHEFFATAPDDLSKVKYTKADIASLIEEQSLNAKVSADQVYRSAKIPFAYDYYDKSNDTYFANSEGWHGTHVAGIAAGKNGRLPNGDSFDSVAPEAQLILMSASNNTGRIIHSAAAVAAIDDAAKLGADAINLSFGAAYDYDDVEKTKVINAARNAGIFVAASSGNAGRGYDMSVSVPVTMPDYAASGTPNNAAGATGVASANNTAVWNSGATVCLPGGDPIFVRDMRRFLKTFPSGSMISYAYYGQGTVEEFQGVDASGKVAVILRGNGSFNEKVTRAAAAGAIGVILVNNTDTDANPGVTAAVNTPVGWINHYSDGAALLQTPSGTLTVGEGNELKTTPEGISFFSSWGTNASLDLKPEITTPGYNVYSSYPNGQYTLLSGTSMAAPHAAGAAAVLAQYMKEELPDYLGNRAALIENLMMSTASQLLQSGTNIPYSPRAQGAGHINLAAAIETPVILCGTDGKSKVNLGEVEDTFTISFDAVNLSDTSVSYDEIGLTVLTDDYASDNGVNVVDGTRELAHTVTSAPSSVTVSPSGSQSVSLTVSLNAADLAANSQVFTNGFFVEGFVTLSDSTDTLPDLSIPYMGFYGGWEKAPIIDPIGGWSGKTAVTFSLDANTSIKLGQNPVLEWMKNQDAAGYAASYEANANQYEGAAYAAWSPNGDACMDTIGMDLYYLRTATNVELTVSDGMEEERIAQWSGHIDKYEEQVIPLPGTADEGEYTFAVKGRVLGTSQSLPKQVFSFALTSDVTPPEVTGYSVTSENGSDILSLSFSDNHYIAGVILTGEDANENETVRYYPTLPDDETTLTVDISDLDRSTLSVKAYDYAGNQTELGYGIFVSEGEVTDLGNDTSTHTFKIVNTTGLTPSAWCAVAIYDGNQMVGMDSQTVQIGEGIRTLSFTLPDVPYDTRKVFVWNSSDDMVPLNN